MDPLDLFDKAVLKVLCMKILEKEHMRKLVDPEDELRWMSQEVRGYVEAVLNSFATNVPKVVVLCQVEKAKEDMLNHLYTSISQDRRVNTGGPKCKRMKRENPEAICQLSVHDNHAAAASWSESSAAESKAEGDEWRSAFGNGYSESRSNSTSQRGCRYSDSSENGDAGARLGSASRRTPNRLPPAPPK